MDTPTASIAIIGGGIGGLAAALSLAAVGVDAHVYEQAQTMRDIGAGIQLSPNASRVLQRLGIHEGETQGVRPLALHQRRWDDGRTLRSTPLGESIVSACGFPYYQTHRADLLQAMIDRLPDNHLHFGHRFDESVDEGGAVEVRFDNGRKVTAHAVIGADGIHSRVRRQIFAADAPLFTGCIAYRGLVRADRLVALQLPVESQVWMGPGKHFVHYFVRGGQQVNFVAVVEQATWTRESWTEQASVAEASKAFEGWHPQVRSIIEAVDQTFVWGLFEHPPLARWSSGCVSLLGDACHAMLPFLAQGGAQSIEDGAVLAACLAASRPEDIPAALQRYESVRLPRTSRIQSASAENKIRFHLADGPQQEERDAAIRDAACDWFLKAIEWIYDYDAAAACERVRK